VAQAIRPAAFRQAIACPHFLREAYETDTRRFLQLAAALLAQVDTGTIAGTLTDSTGAVLAGASVTIATPTPARSSSNRRTIWANSSRRRCRQGRMKSARRNPGSSARHAHRPDAEPARRGQPGAAGGREPQEVTVVAEATLLESETTRSAICAPARRSRSAA